MKYVVTNPQMNFFSAVAFLRTNIPVPLVDGNLATFFRDDANVAQILNQLRESLDPEGRL